MIKNKLNFYITNFITLLRVVGIFALIPTYITYGGVATFILASICFLTDCIDGVLARCLGTSTFFGSLFDAISDKAFLVVNMVLLMKISPLSIIIILFELGILYIQSFKYNKGLNIKSNKYGKIKMWVAGIIISLSYLLTDDAFLRIIHIRPNGLSWFIFLFIPLFISELITFISYLKEYIDSKDIKEIDYKDIEEDIKNTSLKEIMFSHEYYMKYKDYGNLKLVKNLAKRGKNE